MMILILGSSCATQRSGYQTGQYTTSPPGNINYQLFYDNLSPYGQWTSFRDYGYVWIPDAGRNFAPYLTGGRWVVTEFGWTWLSDYTWGWAPFHYGRWDYDNFYGWFWVPGNEWGPSWVIWRRANGYYGWTPMSPGMNINTSITGQATRDVERWNFVRESDFTRTDLHRRTINSRDNEEIFRNSTVINNTYIDNSRSATYVSGPPVSDVQRSTGRRIQSMPVRDADRPGARINNSQLQIYRPRVESMSDKDVPSRIAEPYEIRRDRGEAPRQQTETRREVPIRGQEPATRNAEENTEERPEADPPLRRR